MFIINDYFLAVCFCVVTMLCWGSWANTSKISTERWPFPLFYWDYSLGLIIVSLIYGLTMGSSGDGGRGFIPDLLQADTDSVVSAFLGGVVFNLSNLLIVAAIAVAGLSVAFPIGVGLALVIGVIVNYVKQPQGNPLFLFGGVLLVVVAMTVNAFAAAKVSKSKGSTPAKGLALSVAGGVIMGFFYRFVAASMTLDFVHPDAGRVTPYSGVFIFSIGVFLSNFLWNTFFMVKPVVGNKSAYADYWKNGTVRLHLIGILGGLIWNTGFLFNLIASDKAGPAISYGLGQGSTMIGAAWGVFVFKEFKGAPASYIATMFICFVIGLGLIVIARL
ncbi:MAG TPA: GRP family sugar transporter [Bacteroidota bacterium]|nr:GRP family sugar transporter [Bacteroidota bacterium]